MPGLMTFTATMPLDRLGLLGHADGAHAALADLLEQLVRADHRAGARLGGGWSMVGRRRSRPAGRAGRLSRKLPASAWAASSASTSAPQVGVAAARLVRGTPAGGPGRPMSRAAWKIASFVGS